MAVTHKVTPNPLPGAAAGTALRGAYDVHPPIGAPVCTNSAEKMTMQDNRKIQYDNAFRNGNAISRAPICRGIRKLPKPPVSTAVNRKKTMMVPCMVTNEM